MSKKSSPKAKTPARPVPPLFRLEEQLERATDLGRRLEDMGGELREFLDVERTTEEKATFLQDWGRRAADLAETFARRARKLCAAADLAEAGKDRPSNIFDDLEMAL